MELELTYKQIVDWSKGDESKMHESVDQISAFIEEAKESHPEMARKFLKGQYEVMNGMHICENLARKMVACMWHETEDGKVVKGEAVTPEEAMVLVEDKSEEKQEKCRWDAYVAANAMMHDIAETGLSKSDIMKVAKHFYFHDDDFKEKHKVFWYFKDWIFG